MPRMYALIVSPIPGAVSCRLIIHMENLWLANGSHQRAYEFYSLNLSCGKAGMKSVWTIGCAARSSCKHNSEDNSMCRCTVTVWDYTEDYWKINGWHRYCINVGWMNGCHRYCMNVWWMHGWEFRNVKCILGVVSCRLIILMEDQWLTGNPRKSIWALFIRASMWECRNDTTPARWDMCNMIL